MLEQQRLLYNTTRSGSPLLHLEKGYDSCVKGDLKSIHSSPVWYKRT